MSLKIYFLRHGETTYSIGGGFCGDLDPQLTPEGYKMAQGFADTYSSVPWTAVYSSPKQRAIATAKPLCEAANLKMEVRDGLREISFGEWEGFTVAQVKEKDPEAYISWMTEPAWNPPPKGETSVEIASRAALVIAEIQQQHPTGNVLVVSHKATIRIMLCSLLGIDLGRYRDRINVLAASLSIVKFDTYGPLLEVLGDRYHLPLELRQREGT
jgi:broad specificity phosphatase PhoE